MSPFDRYDIDPLAGIAAITERLAALIDEATTDEERQALREQWESLTLHPERRFREALGAHPESRPPLPPDAVAPLARREVRPLRPVDLAPWPRVVDALAGDPAFDWLGPIAEDPHLLGR